VFEMYAFENNVLNKRLKIITLCRRGFCVFKKHSK